MKLPIGKENKKLGKQQHPFSLYVPGAHRASLAPYQRLQPFVSNLLTGHQQARQIHMIPASHDSCFINARAILILRVRILYHCCFSQLKSYFISLTADTFSIFTEIKTCLSYFHPLHTFNKSCHVYSFCKKNCWWLFRKTLAWTKETLKDVVKNICANFPAWILVTVILSSIT